ncbi:hypothetical protein BJX68DRAFT_278828 [Aspergillus pseudodeflectus]|uniref:Uncharacterized protein n=1 Tax=Aspergillus pseudodeflectus TaxID=176178 RepID=A0ABR4JM31_9EURO
MTYCTFASGPTDDNDLLVCNIGKCTSETPDGPLQITASCIDPLYTTPVITSRSDFSFPIPHHRVSGYFNDTSVDFNIYLPITTNNNTNSNTNTNTNTNTIWPTRFFQLVYPLQNSTAEDEAIAFGADSNAYTVRVAAGIGYRGDAAVAKLSKRIACEYYTSNSSNHNDIVTTGDETEEDNSCAIHGYIYGGSGGSLQTIGAIENTEGVWDGAIALIQAIPISNLNNWAIRALAGLVLDGKSAALVDSVQPGGSGDPLTDAELDLEDFERDVFEEASALGVPLRAWEDFDGVARNRTKLYEVLRTLVVRPVKQADPTFVDDFWGRKGYLGTEESGLGEFFRGSLVEYNDTVQEVVLGADGVPTSIVLGKVPEGSPIGLEFTIVNGDQDLGTFTGLLDKNDKSVYLYGENNKTTLSHLAAGTHLQIDNRWYLAIHTWHRHQIPPLRAGYYGYNDYLRTKNGSPRYPQRDTFLAPSISASASGGGTHTGSIKGKLFVMDNLVDYDAFPWHADWYKQQVQRALGGRADDNFRLYYNDHADHQMGPVPQSLQARLVDFTGIYEHLLRDLSAWVEEGVEPPVPSRYSVKAGQVALPGSAAERRGVQPVVELTVDGRNRSEAAAGESVLFRVRAEAVPRTGKIVSVEWDFEGTGEFVPGELRKASKRVDMWVRHAYNSVGTFLPAVRVAVHRDGDTETVFARVMNLGRARIIVS